MNRVVDVRPPSASGESGYVLRAAGVILFAALFVVTSHRLGSREERGLLPFQRAFTDLDPALQRDYRELREGLVEAARARDMSGNWPAPEKLAGDGIPPFAQDGVGGRVREWRLVQVDRAFLYVGRPLSGSDRPELLLAIFEPPPGDAESADPRSPTDEEHLRLATGPMLHVYAWYRDAPRPGAAAGAADRDDRFGPDFRPEVAGWFQMVRREPSLAAASLVLPAGRASTTTLRVGVTLHPYYSWVANVVAGTDVEVRSILPGEVDAGSYQPRPEDVKKLADLDAIVVNGVGHDDFIDGMLAASGNRKIAILKPSAEVPLLQAHRAGADGAAVNSHTFLSFTNAIQQTWSIARALGKLRPELAATFDKNAADYAKRLRRIKAAAAVKLAGAPIHRVVTVHDGYGYLLQEFGIEIVAVVEPAHGLVPSAAELKEVIDVVKREKVKVLFSEESFPEPLLEVLREQARARVYLLSHVASGDYTADKFEQEMQINVDALVKALVTDASSGG